MLLLGAMSLLECLAFVEEDDANVVREFYVPLLVYHGTEDEMVPFREVVALNSAFRSCTLVTAPGQSHGLSVLDQDPTELVRLVKLTSELRVEEKEIDKEARKTIDTLLLTRHHMKCNVEKWKEPTSDVLESSDSWSC